VLIGSDVNGNTIATSRTILKTSALWGRADILTKTYAKTFFREIRMILYIIGPLSKWEFAFRCTPTEMKHRNIAH